MNTQIRTDCISIHVSVLLEQVKFDFSLKFFKLQYIDSQFPLSSRARRPALKIENQPSFNKIKINLKSI